MKAVGFMSASSAAPTRPLVRSERRVWIETKSARRSRAYSRSLAPLPRPLWISVYDNGNIGEGPMADWLQSWLPADVGVFFQDGVGLHTRDPGPARRYADALRQRLGPHRFRLIAEAFRPAPKGFRPAQASELLPQLRAYAGHAVFVFDGPHYLHDDTIEALRRA